MGTAQQGQGPAISVIVPVYKAQRYLDACVQSLLAQTYTDFEVLLIEDDSPDACGAMCDAWAAQDGRIRALHLKDTGVGPSVARNTGLEQARGAWLTFVDSDDTVEPDYLEQLWQGAQRSGARWVMCNSHPVSEAGEALPYDAAQTFAEDTLLDEAAFWQAFHTPKINLLTGTAHKLYDAALFDGLRYPVGMLNEDYYLVPDLIERAGGMYCLAYCGYHVVQHAGSITEGARHEVRLYQTMGDIHRGAYFTRRGWYDLAEGALTDAARFLQQNRAGYDLSKPGHRAAWRAVAADLKRAYDELAQKKGADRLKCGRWHCVPVCRCLRRTPACWRHARAADRCPGLLPL